MKNITENFYAAIEQLLWKGGPERKKACFRSDWEGRYSLALSEKRLAIERTEFHVSNDAEFFCDSDAATVFKLLVNLLIFAAVLAHAPAGNTLWTRPWGADVRSHPMEPAAIHCAASPWSS